MCDFDHVAIHWFASVTHSSCVIPDGLRRLFCILSMQEIGGGLSLMERFILADTQLWKGQSQQGHCGKVSHYRVTVKRSVTTGSLWKGQSLQGHCGKVSHYRGTVERSVTTGALWKGQSLQWHCAKVSHYRVTMERSVTTGNRVTVERSVTTGSL